jgi:hypothetical protein
VNVLDGLFFFFGPVRLMVSAAAADANIDLLGEKKHC